MGPSIGPAAYAGAPTIGGETCSPANAWIRKFEQVGITQEEMLKRVQLAMRKREEGMALQPDLFKEIPEDAPEVQVGLTPQAKAFEQECWLAQSQNVFEARGSPGFWSCLTCNESFPVGFLQDHVNKNTHQTQRRIKSAVEFDVEVARREGLEPRGGGQWYCPACMLTVYEGSLQEHTENAKHQKWMYDLQAKEETRKRHENNQAPAWLRLGPECREYCVLCGKEATESHLQSDRHQQRLYQHNLGQRPLDLNRLPFATSPQLALTAPGMEPPPPPPPAAQPAMASSAAAAAAAAEFSLAVPALPGQQPACQPGAVIPGAPMLLPGNYGNPALYTWDNDKGWFFCRLCYKVADDNHILSKMHKRRALTPECYLDSLDSSHQLATSASPFGQSVVPWFDSPAPAASAVVQPPPPPPLPQKPPPAQRVAVELPQPLAPLAPQAPQQPAAMEELIAAYGDAIPASAEFVSIQTPNGETIYQSRATGETIANLPEGKTAIAFF